MNRLILSLDRKSKYIKSYQCMNYLHKMIEFEIALKLTRCIILI